MQNENDELRARIAVLERDVENLMEFKRQMVELFAIIEEEDDNRTTIGYTGEEMKSLYVIIRRIEKGNVIKPVQFDEIIKLSDESTYSGADWLRYQLMGAFKKSHARINNLNLCSEQPAFKFDDLKTYLEDFSKMSKKADVDVYMKNFKSKDGAK
jgi:hypothetical protein